ncbi:copper transporter [Isoptericola chiayiensis]|uniref:Copper transporter n=1 Tax=Isoptericola chiayiensis TaxID=579446 RepID=A0ABP8YCF1_9MICO|nr:hypothetical protein [Isoptericola chiayiensis]
MIDFRYHLVSLISVFLALAVGIILGAGPLQNAIGDQLTDQVEALRDERTALRDSLAETEAELSDQNAFALAAGAELVDGSLDGVAVAVVDADAVPDTLEIEVVNQLEAAGARVVAQTSLTPAWSSLEDEVLRGTVADGQRSQLGDLVPQDATTSEVLGTVLGLSLTEADAQGSGARAERAVELYQLLASVGLLESRFAPSAPADAVLLLAPGGEDAAATASPDDEAPAEDVDMVSTVSALEEIAGTTVVAGPTLLEGDLVADVRGDEQVAESVSTVSGIEQEILRMDVPLALAAQHAGQVGHYGFEEGATPVPPAVDLSAGDDTSDGADDSGDDSGTDGSGAQDATGDETEESS